MENYGIIMTIIIGSISGWLAGLLMKGKGMGFIINTIVGIVGAMWGQYVFELIGFSVSDGLIGTIFSATSGAVLLLFIMGFIRKSQ